jgi:hypothetical protein
MAQRYTARMNISRLACTMLLACLPVVALAQWQWLDKDGRKVFSDQPPPADIPPKNILKQPAAKPAAAPAADTEKSAAAPTGPAAAGSPKPAASAPKLETRDKDLEARKKQAEAAEAAKKKEAAEKQAKARADNCARARQAKTTYESGTRIARTNAKGEREVMDDAAKAVEIKRLEGIMANECAPAGAPASQ